MSDELPDLNFLDSAAIQAEFKSLDLKKKDEQDPWMVWRTRVNEALGEEGINIMWGPESEFAVVQPIVMDDSIRDYEKIPVMHLRELYEADDDDAANPKAVAAYIKATLYDKRFRLWKYEE